MKILMVSTFAPPNGGAASIAYDQAHYLMQRFHHKVSFLTYEKGFGSLKGATIHTTSGIRIKGDFIPSFLSAITIFSAVRQSDLVVVHSTYNVLENLAAVLAKIFRKRAVCINHGNLGSKTRNRLNIAFMNKLVKKWLVVNQEDRHFLKKFVKKLKPCAQINNGINYQELVNASRKREKRKCSTFVFCGGLVREKGLPELIKAIAAFPECRFKIIGDGPFLNAVKELQNVTAYGRVAREKTWEIISSADCLILPSYHETFGLVVAEAVAMNVPVIITRLNSAINSIAEGNGLIIPPHSSDALIEAIKKAHEEGLMVENGDQAKALDWSNIIEQINDELLQTS